MSRLSIIISLGLSISIFLPAQKVSDAEIKRRIESYKTDSRGPFKEIRWYCPDGSIIPPNERCPQPGGVQRARHKDEVTQLSKTNHIFLGQILATTPFPDFWDEEYYHSRMKQYQLEKFLVPSDQGWIQRKSQFYRGAYQAEDEENWGIAYFNWLLESNKNLEQNFFLIRQAVKDIPHAGDDNLSQFIRVESKNISEAYPAFMDIRVKIHGQPDYRDIGRVIDFRKKHLSKMPPEILQKMDKLIVNMEDRYKPFQVSSLKQYMIPIPKESVCAGILNSFMLNYATVEDSFEKITLLSTLLFDLRLHIGTLNSPAARLSVLDISILMENLLFQEQSDYFPPNLESQLATVYYMGMAAAGSGYLELWEWDRLKNRLNISDKRKISIEDLMANFDAGRNIIEWGTGMFMAVYEDVINLYAGFEPLAEGFLDEKVRSSILLPLGIVMSDLGDLIATHLPSSNSLMGIRGQSSARGLNSGLAMGELVIVTGNPEEVKTDNSKIYIFNKPPSDLKPVSGIATVTEGNPVSHVQLLARNLGIPNAVISLQNMEELSKFNGQLIFYAVSPKGAVMMKAAEMMTEEEKALFAKKVRSENKIAVDVNRIDLSHNKILSMREIDASASGRICGPKAANLAQLKQMFPENVVEGLIIPFGIFREHLNQMMPGSKESYWEFLTNMFAVSQAMMEDGIPEIRIDDYMMKELETFRQAISHIQISGQLLGELRSRFKEVFGKSMGEIPVFLRSDTNMEDLKDFTGAGLNLTLFNVLSEEVILQGIRDVWASPYTERSYKWRQSYLMNPENVFPSILIIPSVDVDYSGVMVTRGISSGNDEDITIAFNHGAGGAVDGQASESYLIGKNKLNVLLAPAREPIARKLPVSGGLALKYTTFDAPIVNQNNISLLWETAESIRRIIPKATGEKTSGPYDIELGFKDDKLWLFQIRPFVENRNSAGSLYLESMDIPIPLNKNVDMNEKLKR